MSEITIKSGGLIVHYRLSSETAADFKAMGEEEAFRQIKSNGLLGGCPTAKPLLDVGLDMDNIFYDENDNVLGTFLISKETCNAQ